MNKLYEKITFNNDAVPALNETNLNIISKAIDDIDDRVVTLGTYSEDAEAAADTAETAKTTAVASATSASASAASAKEYAQEAKGYTPTGYQDLVNIVDDNVNLGYLGKNLLPNNGTTQTINGVTFTKNSDGSVTVDSGTATAQINYAINTLTLKAGITYEISDGTDSVLNGYSLVGRDSTNAWRISTDNLSGRKQYTPTADITLNFVYRIYSGYSHACTFYPMIRYADITDDTYVPYVPSNATLAETDAELAEKDAELVKKDAELTAKATNIMGTSDAYSSATSYAVGAYCIDANALYKCLIACSGVQPSTDTSGCWEKVTLASLASSVPIFDTHSMTRTQVSVTISNTNNWQNITAPQDGYYQLNQTATGTDMITGIGAYDSSAGATLHLYQTRAVSDSSKSHFTFTPPFYFHKGDTIRVQSYASGASTSSRTLYCWS